MISIIIPLYNNEKYITYTLYSIFNQTYKDWEIIIINDASTDNSKYVIKKFINYNNINFIDLKENKGVSFARNIGLKYAKGKYIIFLDSDDFWNEKFLESMYNEIIKEKNKMVYAKYVKFYNNNKIIDPSLKKTEGFLKNFFVYKKNRYELEFPFCIGSVLIEKNILFKYNLFFSENLSHGEDYLFWSKLLCITDCKYVKNATLFYRQHDNSIIHKKYKINDYFEELTYLEKLKDFSYKYNKNITTIINEIIIYRTYRIISICLKTTSTEDILTYIDRYKYRLQDFLNIKYFSWNNKIKCKIFLLKNKYLLKLLKNF